MMNNIFSDTVKPKAQELLKRAKLPEDLIKAANQKSVFLNELNSFLYQIEDGNIVVYDNNGFEVTDPHGWNLSLEQFLKSEFDKYFELSDLPITEAECIDRLRDPGITPAKRKLITEVWDRLKTK